MKLPSFTPKRTVRTVIDLTVVAEGTTLPLSVLREIVEQTSEFGDAAEAKFWVNHAFLNPYDIKPKSPAFGSLVVSEAR